VFVSTTDWSEQVARTIAREVRHLRKPRSAQWLADRCAKLGMPSITRAVIADLENGRRLWVGVTEVMVLARALNTTPAALIYPDPCAANIEMLPGVPATGPLALQWFTGLLDGPTKMAASDDSAAYDRNLRRLQIAREIWKLDERRTVIAFGDMGDTIEKRREWADAVADYQRRIDALMREYATLTGREYTAGEFTTKPPGKYAWKYAPTEGDGDAG
jgi:hypothetical protein